MLKATYQKHVLHFKNPAGTSRGVLYDKPTFFVKLWHDQNPEIVGIGECSTIVNLSPDHRTDYENQLSRFCREINEAPDLTDWSSIRFGMDMAQLDLQQGGTRTLFQNAFSKGQAGIPINGLIWMGERDFMQKQIREKIEAGYRCIKMKIGALDFKTELVLLKEIRKSYRQTDIELRVDANGAFSVNGVMEKLNRLAELDLHSIEQPIKQGQTEAMARICNESPVPIALDEELIGVTDEREKLLTDICPEYIILKPSLLGGFAASREWIELAEKHQIGWWVTSALESNIGLNAIAQWTYEQLEDDASPLPQGLGTGQLYTNNIDSPLTIENGHLFYGTGRWSEL